MAMIQVSTLSRKSRGAWETRRREKILYPPERVWSALTEARQLEEWWCDKAELDLRPGVLDKYLYANAERFFFSERKPRYA